MYFAVLGVRFGFQDGAAAIGVAMTVPWTELAETLTLALRSWTLWSGMPMTPW